MRWTKTTDAQRPPPAAVRRRLLEQATSAQRAEPAWLIGRAWTHVHEGEIEEAIQAFERAAHIDPRGFAAWADLAFCYAMLDRLDDALAACRHGAQDDPLVLRETGRVLRRLERHAEADVALKSALDHGAELDALEMLVRPLAQRADGGRLLDLCDELKSRFDHTAVLRAFRAVALSRLGREDEARQLVDLERHVVRVPFAPPDGTIEAFNEALSAEVLARPSPFKPPVEGVDIRYQQDFQAGPAMDALFAFMRREIERYIDAMSRLGLDRVLPQAPDAAQLYTSRTVLRGEGRNGQHIHGHGLVSVVYHVRVPDAVPRSDDRRGALALGCCEAITGGYAPCWGVRHIQAEPGWLTLFPSHVFHDVVPTMSQSPRISVVADLKPVEA